MPLMVFGRFEAATDHLDVLRRGLATSLRLLLEGVQDVHRLLELDGIDGPVSIALMIIDYFEHPGSAKPFEGLSVAVNFSGLCQK